MKNTLFIGLIAAAASLMSCSKESTDPAKNSNTVTVKYDFTADKPAAYRFSYRKDTTMVEERVTTQTWSKTVTVSRTSAYPLARLSVFPPDSWINSHENAMVNLQLTVNGSLADDTTAILPGLDHYVGMTVETTN